MSYMYLGVFPLSVCARRSSYPKPDGDPESTHRESFTVSDDKSNAARRHKPPHYPDIGVSAREDSIAVRFCQVLSAESSLLATESSCNYKVSSDVLLLPPPG